ncbi:MAG: sigma-70 family RNA polymerase sigma factor [Planctomycetota bacterium]|jgi:RNA polymerase primary sigma factor
MPQPVDPIKDLMFRSLSRAKLLTPEEEITLSQQCRSMKVTVWSELLSDASHAGEVLAYAVDRMSNKSKQGLDDSNFETLCRRAAALRRSNSKYRFDKWDQARQEVAPAVSEQDICLRIGGSLLQDMKDGSFESSPEWIRRVDRSWRRFVRLRNEFIEKNMRLVIMISKRYRGFSIPHEDLIQEGVFGLQRAIDLFDPDRGFKFSTYSSWWIRAAIQRYCRDKGRVVRIPVHMQEAFEKYNDTKRKGGDLDDAAIADAMGISEKKVKVLKGMHHIDYFSLDAKLTPNSESTLGDMLPADDIEFRLANVSLDMQLVGEVLQELPDRERYIIECRFGLNGREEHTLQEIATEYEMSRERIRQLQVKGMAELRKRIERRAESIQAGLR